MFFGITQRPSKNIWADSNYHATFLTSYFSQFWNWNKSFFGFFPFYVCDNFVRSFIKVRNKYFVEVFQC